MKVFIDTNIFLEYFQQRQQYLAVSKLFSAIEDNIVEAVISSGCIYTLAYLVCVELKRIGVHRPTQTERLRQTLNTILSIATVVDMTHQCILIGVNDTDFDDIEDSFQHQCAVYNQCDAIVTINKRDFVGSHIPVFTPAELVEQLSL